MGCLKRETDDSDKDAGFFLQMLKCPRSIYFLHVVPTHACVKGKSEIFSFTIMIVFIFFVCWLT